MQGELTKLLGRCSQAASKCRTAEVVVSAARTKAKAALALQAGTRAVADLEASQQALKKEEKDLEASLPELPEAEAMTALAGLEPKLEELQKKAAEQVERYAEPALAGVRKRAKAVQQLADQAVQQLLLLRQEAELQACRQCIERLRAAQKETGDILPGLLEAGEVTAGKLAAFLELGDEAAARLFAYLDEAGAGKLCENNLRPLLTDTFKCVKAIGVSEAVDTKSKVLKTLGVGELVQRLQGPEEEPETQIQRIQVRCIDGLVGWTTPLGNQGSVFLESHCAGQLKLLDEASKARKLREQRKRTLLQQAEDVCAVAEQVVSSLTAQYQAKLEALSLAEVALAQEAKRALQRDQVRIRPAKIAAVKGLAQFEGETGFAALQARCEAAESKVKELLQLAEAAPKQAQERQDALDARREEALAALRKEARGTSFAELAAACAEDGKVQAAALGAKAAALGVQLSDPELAHVLAFFDRGEGVSEAAFAARLQPKFACVAKVGVSAELSIGSKILRQLQVGEVVDALDETVAEEKTNVDRVQIRTSSGEVGFVTLKGNQGTVYLQPAPET